MKEIVVCSNIESSYMDRFKMFKVKLQQNVFADMFFHKARCDI